MNLWILAWKTALWFNSIKKLKCFRTALDKIPPSYSTKFCTLVIESKLQHKVGSLLLCVCAYNLKQKVMKIIIFKDLQIKPLYKFEYKFESGVINTRLSTTELLWNNLVQFFLREYLWAGRHRVSNDMHI